MAGFRSKANWALGAVTAGYLVSYPFSYTLAGGLAASACGAAMIGGIADWFAVTALFRRPLGISYRTALIPRNRDKILQIMADMVEKELLNPSAMKQTLEQYDLAAVLLQYMTRQGGVNQVKAVLRAAVVGLLQDADWQKLARIVEWQLRRELKQYRLAPAVAAILGWSMQSGYGDTIISFLLEEANRLVSHPQVPKLAGKLVGEAQITYEQGKMQRVLFNRLVEQVLELTPERAGAMAQQQLLQTLAEWQQPDHPIRSQIRQWLLKLAARLEQDETLQSLVERWKEEQLSRPGLFQPYLADLIERLLIKKDGERDWLDTFLGRLVDEGVARLRNDEALRRNVDKELKDVAARWLDTSHHELGSLVRTRLETLSAADLAAFVESRAGNDLQMIRINGSLVGGMLGTIIYLATRWLS